MHTLERSKQSEISKQVSGFFKLISLRFGSVPRQERRRPRGGGGCCEKDEEGGSCVARERAERGWACE
jgi:hypothetical protein